MNRSTLLIVILACGLLIGFGTAWWLLKSGKPDVRPSSPPATASDSKAQAEEPEVLYWVAPMDSNYRRDKPGKSPMGMDLVPVYKDQSGTVEDESVADSIRIRPEVVQNLGIRTEVAEIRPLWRRIEATGYVGLDENRLNHIHVRTPGWIEQLLVDSEGERVTRGQVLFEFYSPELTNAQKEFLQAARRGEASLQSAAREKLQALGMQAFEIDQVAKAGEARKTIQVVSPANGVVSHLNVRDGMYIKPEDAVMGIADLSTVWMQAEIFESQADWVKRGQSAEARLEYLPGEVFAGQVDYVYPVLDPRTRTLRVRLRFDNPNERLKPNMYARVTIYGRTHQDALTIPRDAVIRGAGNDRVVLDLGNGRFSVSEVMTGIESGEWVEIIAGLKSGDEVVTSAQFLIDSEASMSGSLRRLDSRDGTSDERPKAVFGSGTVTQMNIKERRMTINHGPIDALGWPSMTMEFTALPMVDLSRIQKGQSVHFSIRPDSTGVYVVDMVHLVDKQGEVPEPEGD